MADGVGWRIARRDVVRQWEVSWMDQAVEAGLALVARHRPVAILATAPPFETLKAALVLHQRTGVPLVADFRDPWTYGVLWNPQTRRRARLEQAWERRVIEAAAKVIVVTPSMQRAFVEKYPAIEDRVHLIMNGYEDLDVTAGTPPAERFVLRYVGSIMERRFPDVLFEALRRLRARNHALAADISVEFVGPNQCPFSLVDRIAAEGLSDIVSYRGPVGHERGRQLMRESHLLLHIETIAHYAVSSKLFEYMAARRPILGIVPRGSDDETFLLKSGAGVNAGVDDPERLVSAIHDQWIAWRDGEPVAAVDAGWLAQFHRREQVHILAGLLDQLEQPAP